MFGSVPGLSLNGFSQPGFLRFFFIRFCSVSQYLDFYINIENYYNSLWLALWIASRSLYGILLRGKLLNTILNKK